MYHYNHKLLRNYMILFTVPCLNMTWPFASWMQKKAADRLKHRTLILDTGVLITLDNYQTRDDQTTISH